MILLTPSPILTALSKSPSCLVSAMSSAYLIETYRQGSPEPLDHSLAAFLERYYHSLAFNFIRKLITPLYVHAWQSQFKNLEK